MTLGTSFSNLTLCSSVKLHHHVTTGVDPTTDKMKTSNPSQPLLRTNTSAMGNRVVDLFRGLMPWTHSAYLTPDTAWLCTKREPYNITLTARPEVKYVKIDADFSTIHTLSSLLTTRSTTALNSGNDRIHMSKKGQQDGKLDDVLTGQL